MHKLTKFIIINTLFAVLFFSQLQAQAVDAEAADHAAELAKLEEEFSQFTQKADQRQKSARDVCVNQFQEIAEDAKTSKNLVKEFDLSASRMQLENLKHRFEKASKCNSNAVNTTFLKIAIRNAYEECNKILSERQKPKNLNMQDQSNGLDVISSDTSIDSVKLQGLNIMITQVQKEIIRIAKSEIEDKISDIIIAANNALKNGDLTRAIKLKELADETSNFVRLLPATATQGIIDLLKDKSCAVTTAFKILNADPKQTNIQDATFQYCFSESRNSPLIFIDAPLAAHLPITDSTAFGPYSINHDLSNLDHQKKAAKRMLYQRGYVPQPHFPLFVYSSALTNDRNIDALPEIAELIMSLGGQLVVIDQAISWRKTSNAITRLQEIMQAHQAINHHKLKIYTDTTKLSGEFFETTVSKYDMILFAADYVITKEPLTSQQTSELVPGMFSTVESALAHWQSTHGN